MKPFALITPLRSRIIVQQLGKSRLFSTSTFLREEETEVKKTKKKSSDSSNSFNPRYLGVTAEMFIPASAANLPSVFSKPLVLFNALIRRCYAFGFNTFKIALFRFQTGNTPKFLLWKNNAIELYIQVNKAFANKNIKPINSEISIWVEEALVSRVQKLPKDLTLDWQIMKFNEVPKLISIEPIMMPGRPLENIQLVYKFNTKQELIKFDKVTQKTEKQVRDIVDYMVFLCDSTNDDMLLIGSVFESPPTAKLPKGGDSDKKQIVKNMRANGDIFRLPPN